MIKKTITFAIAAALFFGCGNTGNKEAASGTEGAPEVIKVKFESLAENPDEYIGKNISVEGKVVHVCRMSGKKLFITGEDPDIRLYISAGEEVSKFPMELLGNEIVVEGTLTSVASSETKGEEGMHAEGEVMEITESDSCETEEALAVQSTMSHLMMVYNKHTVVK